jgi:hypothetical protein
MSTENTNTAHLTSRNARYGAYKLAENNIKKSIQEQGFFNFMRGINAQNTSAIRGQIASQQQAAKQAQAAAEAQKNPASNVPSMPRLLGRSVGKFGVAGVLATLANSFLSGRGLKGGIGDLVRGGVFAAGRAAREKARAEARAKRNAPPPPPTPEEAARLKAEKARQEGEARRKAAEAQRQADINRGIVRTRDTGGYDVAESKKYNLKYLKSKYYK